MWVRFAETISTYTQQGPALQPRKVDHIKQRRTDNIQGNKTLRNVSHNARAKYIVDVKCCVHIHSPQSTETCREELLWSQTLRRCPQIPIWPRRGYIFMGYISVSRDRWSTIDRWTIEEAKGYSQWLKVIVQSHAQANWYVFHERQEKLPKNPFHPFFGFPAPEPARVNHNGCASRAILPKF